VIQRSTNADSTSNAKKKVPFPKEAAAAPKMGRPGGPATGHLLKKFTCLSSENKRASSGPEFERAVTAHSRGDP